MQASRQPSGYSSRDFKRLRGSMAHALVTKVLPTIANKIASFYTAFDSVFAEASGLQQHPRDSHAHRRGRGHGGAAPVPPTTSMASQVFAPAHKLLNQPMIPMIPTVPCAVWPKQWMQESMFWDRRRYNSRACVRDDFGCSQRKHSYLGIGRHMVAQVHTANWFVR